MEYKSNKKASSKSRINTGQLAAIAPVAGLVAVVVVFMILTRGALLSAGNLQAMVNQMILTALVTIGAVFIFGSGFFDMSMGGCVCICAVFGGLTAIRTGSFFLAFAVILLVSLLLGAMKGLIASYVNVPFFIFTIVLGSVITAFVLVILGEKSTIYLKDAVREMPKFTTGQLALMNVLTLALFFGLCLVLFHWTPLGIWLKNLGGNPICARQSGIPVKRTIMTSFFISALGVAIAAFLLLVRTRSVGSTTAGTLGNDVMVALVLGGMPLSGGPRSRISAGLLGAVTITVLNSGLTIMGLSTGMIQICRGIVFIIVVLVSSFSYRSRLLPR